MKPRCGFRTIACFGRLFSAYANVRKHDHHCDLLARNWAYAPELAIDYACSLSQIQCTWAVGFVMLIVFCLEKVCADGAKQKTSVHATQRTKFQAERHHRHIALVARVPSWSFSSGIEPTPIRISNTDNTIQYRSVQYFAGPKVFCFSIEGLSVAWELFLKVFHRKKPKLRVLAAGTVRIFKRS